jgi:DNA-3-methyladenine glycosylase II
MPPPNAQVLQVLRRDPVLVPVIDSLPYPEQRDSSQSDLYFDLLDSIVSQQLSVKAAATIFGRFKAMFPNDYPYPELVLAIDNEELRGVGLSYQKAGYIKNVAQFWIDNEDFQTNWHEMPSEDLLKTLVGIKGVGVWTAQMILMFSLGREDVFPIGDLGIRDAMIRLYQPEYETQKELFKKLEAIATNWQPYRTIACRYMWKWRDAIVRK